MADQAGCRGKPITKKVGIGHQFGNRRSVIALMTGDNGIERDRPQVEIEYHGAVLPEGMSKLS